LFEKIKHLNEAAFLNYHHFRYFWAVAREGSLCNASEKLRISQPSMSTQINLQEEPWAKTCSGQIPKPTPRKPAAAQNNE